MTFKHTPVLEYNVPRQCVKERVCMRMCMRLLSTSSNRMMNKCRPLIIHHHFISFFSVTSEPVDVPASDVALKMNFLKKYLCKITVRSRFKFSF